MRLAISLTVSLLLAWNIAVPAEAATLPAKGAIPFADYDLNHDGSISTDEFNLVQQRREDARLANDNASLQWLMDAPSFEDFDTNADDRISPAELQAEQKRQQHDRH